eukprot:NODE_27_length_2583_cov_409.675896_g26_i0.p1 GENE.NODE_27_length_2583_cov_409.675896_g26_i0~~NODE_27_length_2583_cov_409.675896_g26_i0.p1  ORF type:complete len:748 (-),score=196.53 NODE_27_length_2583_cov_409.675896_g26_i0:340-2319(-)
MFGTCIIIGPTGPNPTSMMFGLDCKTISEYTTADCSGAATSVSLADFTHCTKFKKEGAKIKCTPRTTPGSKVTPSTPKCSCLNKEYETSTCVAPLAVDLSYSIPWQACSPVINAKAKMSYMPSYDCKKWVFYNSTDCSGKSVYTFNLDGSCAPGVNGTSQTGTCTAEGDLPPPPPTPPTPPPPASGIDKIACHCLEHAYVSKTACTGTTGDNSTAWEMFGTCTNVDMGGTKTSVMFGYDCKTLHTYTGYDCKGTPVDVDVGGPGWSTCIKHSGQLKELICTPRSTPGRKVTPDTPRCRCTDSTFSDKTCTPSSLTSSTTFGYPKGVCTNFTIGTGPTAEVSSSKTDDTCSKLLLYNGGFCQGDPIGTSWTGSCSDGYSGKCTAIPAPQPPSPPPSQPPTPPAGQPGKYSCLCKEATYMDDGCKGQPTYEDDWEMRGACTMVYNKGAPPTSSMISLDCTAMLLYNSPDCTGPSTSVPINGNDWSQCLPIETVGGVKMKCTVQKAINPITPTSPYCRCSEGGYSDTGCGTLAQLTVYPLPYDICFPFAVPGAGPPTTSMIISSDCKDMWVFSTGNCTGEKFRKAEGRCAHYGNSKVSTKEWCTLPAQTPLIPPGYTPPSPPPPPPTQPAGPASSDNSAPALLHSTSILGITFIIMIATWLM